MKVNRDENKSVRAVNVNVEASQVARLVSDLVARNLLIDVDVASTHLSVEFNSHHEAYVRGEVPLTRKQLLESLGLTPTEPVETEGAAIAEEFAHLGQTLDESLRQSDHVLRDEDVATVVGYRHVTAEDIRRLRAHLDLLSAQPGGAHSTVALRRVVEALERCGYPQSDEVQVDGPLDDTPDTLAKYRMIAENALSADDENSAGLALLRVVESLERGPGPALGDNPGVQVGTGTYAPESEVLPEVREDETSTELQKALQLVDHAKILNRPLWLSDVFVLSGLLTAELCRRGLPQLQLPARDSQLGGQVDRTEGVHPLIVEFDDLFSMVGLLPARRERANELRTKLVERLAGDVSPLVPRGGPTTDCVMTAREKVKHLYERQFHHGQAPRAQDLAYLYALLGGGDL